MILKIAELVLLLLEIITRLISLGRIRQYANTDKSTNVLGIIEAAEKMGFCQGVKGNGCD
jgi:NADPH-dependent curcumin reductase CurA